MRIFTAEHKRKISEALKGRKRPIEVCRKMANSMRGFKHSDETKKKMSLAGKGRKFSEEHKRKISQANMGRPSPLKGKIFSEEHRKRISEGQKGEKGNNWKGGLISKICIVCNKEYKRKRHRSLSRFCSNRCSVMYRNKYEMKHYDTGIELKMAGLLEMENIPYQKQVFILGIATPDFLLPNNIIVQCDGDYWHSIPKVKNRDINQDFIFGFRGYEVLRFSETDINKHPVKCISKIKSILDKRKGIEKWKS